MVEVVEGLLLWQNAGTAERESSRAHVGIKRIWNTSLAVGGTSSSGAIRIPLRYRLA
jgi:hypothetical protein